LFAFLQQQEDEAADRRLRDAHTEADRRVAEERRAADRRSSAQWRQMFAPQ